MAAPHAQPARRRPAAAPVDDLGAPPHRRTFDRASRPTASRRVGYVAAIVVNAVLLALLPRLGDWDWARFLTDAFDEQLVPLISLSLIATMAVNAAFVCYDSGWFKALGDLVTAAIGVAVMARALEVFPFDFSTYATDWSPLIRLVLVVGLVGTAIAVAVDLVRLVSWPFRAHDGGR